MRCAPLALLAGLALAACSNSPTATKMDPWALAGTEGMRACADSLKAPGAQGCDVVIPDGRLLVQGDASGKPVGFVRFWYGTGETTNLRFTNMRDSLRRALGAPKCSGGAFVWRRDSLDVMLARRTTGVPGHGTDAPSWAVVVGVGPAEAHSAGEPCAEERS